MLIKYLLDTKCVMLKECIPISSGVLFEINAHTAIQLAFETDCEETQEKIIKNLADRVAGLHMFIKGDKIMYTHDRPPIIKLPIVLGSNNKGIEETTIDFATNHQIDPNIRFGTIGYNDKYVILNISHSVGDGGYFRFLTENILNDSHNDINNKKLYPSHFPFELKEIFPEKYAKAPLDILFWDKDPRITRIQTNFPQKLNKDAKDVKYVTKRFPINKLKCFSNGKLQGFTNSLWMSLFVSSLVHKNSNKNKSSSSSNFDIIPSEICIPTCIDFRNYIKKEDLNYSVGSCYSVVSPSAKVSPKMTLAEIGKEMKADLTRRMMRGEDFGFMKLVDTDSSISDFDKNAENKQNGNQSDNIEKFVAKPSDVGVELTYMGPCLIQSPKIRDVFVNLSMDACATENILSLMGFGIVSNNKGKEIDEKIKNEVVMRLRYTETKLCEEEVKKIANGIEHILNNIPMDTPLEAAIKEITNFSKSQ